MIYEVPSAGVAEVAAIDRIDELRRQLRYAVAEPKRWVGSVRRVLSARAIQASNGIEGYHVSVEDALAALQGDEPADAHNEDWQAVSSYRRALTYVLQLAQDEHFELGAGLIRSLHFMMTEHDLGAGPGLWRPGAIWIRNDQTGVVVYEGPDAAAVPRLIDELVEQLSLEADAHALVRGAMAHLNLAMIHPFRDGNGRMARCLQTLVLAREGILAPEFSSIEEYLGANTSSYYEILGEVGKGRWSPHHDALPWVRYCLRAHFVQATSVLRRVQESELVWLELEDLARRNKLQERCCDALYDASVGMRVRNSSYRASLKGWQDISQETATADLGAMVKAGLLDKRGQKRGTYYVAGPPLVDIRRRLVAGRQPVDTTSLFDP
jgi:Fic family protein